MKTNIHLTIAAVTMLACLAFNGVNNDGMNVTYGVSLENPSQIELQLHSDYTFTFQDFSSVSNKVKVSGTYEIKNNKIFLTADDERVKFHNIWKVGKNASKATSRRGLTFYTLQKK